MKKLTAIVSALLFAGLTCCSSQRQNTKIIPETKAAPLKLELKVGMPRPRPTKKLAQAIKGPDFIMATYGDQEHIEMVELYQCCRNIS